MGEVCCICGNPSKEINFYVNKSVSSDARLINHAIRHRYCDKCGYIFIDEKYRIDRNKFYKDDYDFLLDGDVEPTIKEIKYSQYLVNLFSKYIRDKKDLSFFDIGSGKGNFIKAMHEKFSKLKYTALEPSKAFKVLKNNNFISELHNNFFEFKNKNKKKYNYLSLIGVLEHVPNPKSFLLDIRNIMNISSYLLIEVPNFTNNKSDLLTVDHISKFTHESIKNLFNVVGFEIIEEQVLSTVPMQYVLRIQKEDNIKILDVKNDINNAVAYLKQAFSDAEKLKNKKIAIYGQGLIMEYLLGSGILNYKNIVCIVDDNPLYQVKKWKNKLPIVNLNKYFLEYEAIYMYLAMNDCYHKDVLKKLTGHKVHVYGAVK